MASTPKDTKTVDLQQDPLIDKLSPEPDGAGPLNMFTGYLGKSPKEGKWRLYSSPQLDNYIEFNESDVHHVQPLTPAESATGGSRVWLRQGAMVEHTQLNSRQLQAEFLSGQIAARNMGTATQSFGGRAARRPVCMTMAVRCVADSVDLCRTEPIDNSTFNQHIPACRSDGLGHCGGPGPTFGGCVTDAGGPFCNSGAFVCGPSAGCTYGPECGQQRTQVLCTLDIC